MMNIIPNFHNSSPSYKENICRRTIGKIFFVGRNQIFIHKKTSGIIIFGM
jgi:hypothetical protein